MSSLQTPTGLGGSAADPEAVSALQSGAAFTCVLADDPAARSAALEASIESIADLRTRFIRVGNPLRSPLTIERLLIQAAGNDAGSYYDRTAQELTRVLAGPRGDESRTILVVEQAETLDAEAVRVLRDMSVFFAAGTPTLQVLFCGQTAFRALLDGPPSTPVAVSVAPPLVEAAAVAAPAPPPPAPPPSAEPVRVVEPVEFLPLPVVPRVRRRTWPILLFVLLLAVVIAATLWVTYPDQAARLVVLARQKIELWRAVVMPSPPPT